MSGEHTGSPLHIIYLDACTFRAFAFYPNQFIIYFAGKFTSKMAPVGHSGAHLRHSRHLL